MRRARPPGRRAHARDVERWLPGIASAPRGGGRGDEMLPMLLPSGLPTSASSSARASAASRASARLSRTRTTPRTDEPGCDLAVQGSCQGSRRSLARLPTTLALPGRPCRKPCPIRPTRSRPGHDVRPGRGVSCHGRPAGCQSCQCHRVSATGTAVSADVRSASVSMSAAMSVSTRTSRPAHRCHPGHVPVCHARDLHTDTGTVPSAPSGTDIAAALALDMSGPTTDSAMDIGVFVIAAAAAGAGRNVRVDTDMSKRDVHADGHRRVRGRRAEADMAERDVHGEGRPALTGGSAGRPGGVVLLEPAGALAGELAARAGGTTRRSASQRSRGLAAVRSLPPKAPALRRVIRPLFRPVHHLDHLLSGHLHGGHPPQQPRGPHRAAELPWRSHIKIFSH